MRVLVGVEVGELVSDEVKVEDRDVVGVEETVVV